ncbi:T6SS immunity protein Tdi1 domain-containing protein [Peristeroidobacter agariperforans]|uniref:T6SS immunity protein Tdi1 domain-containing protein n=1 Tax=Peristeroidobacter agariperforans TaxID=268404 RepID=UPI00101C2777|nr:T6SS immunity protein Tdi1 domain-containing protein [Peristeroidobacter agariperforans]
MTLNDLTVNFSHLNREAILSEWEWLIGTHKLPILLAASGDAFVQDVNDGSIHILDTLEAKLQKVADSVEEFRTLLSDRQFVGSHFAVQMVGELRSSGCVLQRGQIYSFKHPPVLGGEVDVGNVEVSDIEVHFSVSGQIHRQVSRLPPGTRIDKVVIE